MGGRSLTIGRVKMDEKAKPSEKNSLFLFLAFLARLEFFAMPYALRSVRLLFCYALCAMLSAVLRVYPMDLMMEVGW